MNRVMEPSALDMLRLLAADGGKWAEAEIRLARAEGQQVLRGGLKAVIAAVAGLVVAIIAAGILAYAAVVALTPLLGPLAAAIVVGLALLALAALSLAWAYRTIVAATREPKVFRRWFGMLKRMTKP